MIRILLLLAGMYLFPGGNITLKGHLKNDPKNKFQQNLGKRTVVVKYKDQELARTISNGDGDFTMNLPVDKKIKSYEFYFLNGKDSFLLEKIDAFESDQVEMDFFVKMN